MPHVVLESYPGLFQADGFLVREGRHPLPIGETMNPLNALQFIQSELKLSVLLPATCKYSFNTAFYRAIH